MLAPRSAEQCDATEHKYLHNNKTRLGSKGSPRPPDVFDRERCSDDGRTRHRCFIRSRARSPARPTARAARAPRQATNGREALEVLQRDGSEAGGGGGEAGGGGVYDLMLLDFVMPVLDGIACITAFRKWETEQLEQLAACRDDGDGDPRAGDDDVADDAMSGGDDDDDAARSGGDDDAMAHDGRGDRAEGGAGDGRRLPRRRRRRRLFAVGMSANAEPEVRRRACICLSMMTCVDRFHNHGFHNTRVRRPLLLLKGGCVQLFARR